MTVASTTNRKQYAGDGLSTSFATNPVVFFDAADLIVYVVDDTTDAVTTLTLDTHYSVTGGSRSTGTVNTAGGSSPYGAPAAGVTLVILRDLAITQESNFVNNDSSDAEVAESALDRLTMIAQQLDARIDRTLHLADSDTSGADVVIPVPAANSIFGWNAAGTALVNYVIQTGTSLVDLAASTGGTLIGWIQTGTGAVLRTIADVFRDRLSAFDFMTAAQIADVRAGTALIDVTAALRLGFAQALSSKRAFYMPAGDYLVTNTAGLPNVLTDTGGSYIYGDGRRQSRFVFAPTAAGAVIKQANGAAKVTHSTVRDVGFHSTDSTFTKVAIDAYDLSSCSYNRIRIAGTGGSGPSAGACWSGNSNTCVGIRFHGREAVTVSDYEIVADIPFQFSANPNTARTDGEDCDHFSFHDGYTVANANPHFKVDDGIGVMELTVSGRQAWVGGTGVCKINDTRVAPTVTSRGISFENGRHEQMTDTAAYSFDLVFTQAVQQLGLKKVLMAAGAHGIKLSGFEQVTLKNVTGAQGAGKDCIVTAGATASSTLAMTGCKWQSGSNFTLTGLTAILISAFRPASFAGPSDAVYSGQITGTLVNVEKVTATAPDGTEGLLVTGTAGDAFQVLPQAAGSGASIRALNNAKNDFTPMSHTAKTFERRYRTGAGTSAVADQIDTSGQLGLAKRFFPAQDTGAIQTASGMFAGTGVPNNANGSNGDFYLRGDGTKAGGTCVYHKEGGAWVAVI